nr:O-succinylbenzoate-CoA synthase [Salmonella sp. NCTC 7297]
MRSAQVYRWQIPMDAGVVLRDRRLKTRDGLYVCLHDGEREGWGRNLPASGVQSGNVRRGPDVAANVG